MRRLIGSCIDACSRRALRGLLGLRLPAARIRQNDQLQNRAFVAEQLRVAIAEVRELMAELNRIDCELAAQDRELQRMQQQRETLRTASDESERAWRITP